MMSNRILLLSALALASASVFVAPARAEDDVILFKIHDVVPIKNSDNQTTACDYHLTAYNRSQKNVSSASLLLTWTDRAIDSVIQEENKVREKNKDSKDASTLPNTSLTTPVQITSQVEISKLAPQKQVSLRARIQSDRCFLLTEDVGVKVKSCTLAEDNTSNDNRRRAVSSRNSTTPCEGLFQFVSPENPEYYREFKPISYDDEQNQSQKKRNQDRIDINTQYDAVTMEISKISTILEGIKSEVPVDAAKTTEQNNDNLKDKLDNVLPAEDVEETEEIVEIQETVSNTMPAQANAQNNDAAMSNPTSILPEASLQAPAETVAQDNKSANVSNNEANKEEKSLNK